VSEDRKALNEYKKRLRDAEEVIEILKKAFSIFAKEAR
jgi:hypothetical protein